MKDVNPKLSAFAKNKIGVRLSSYFIAICLFFGLSSIVTVMCVEYSIKEQQALQAIDNSVDSLEEQLAKDLWEIDNDAIGQTLIKLHNLAGVKAVELQGENQRHTLGIPSQQPNLIQDIFYRNQPVGKLSLHYADDDIRWYVISRFLDLAIYIVSVIVIMAFVFYLIVNRSVIRHIAYISRHRSDTRINEKSHFKPLELARKPRDDELSDLVNVLNDGRKRALELLEAKQVYQEQMEYQANFDLLTGLPNRRHLYDYLSKAIDQYHAKQGQLAVMFVDLDGFKQINDSMGHAVGDHVLRVCADRLKSFAERINGFIARLGGDEFILCFYVYDSDELKQTALATRHVFDDRIESQGLQVNLSCSIGITLYPDHPIDEMIDLIRHADCALYKAKDTGKNTYYIFNNAMREQIACEKLIKSRLSCADLEKDFVIHYQPLMDIKAEKIIGFEALLRWDDEKLGEIPPETFIGLAEKSGRIFDIDTWVFKKAVNQVKHWRQIYDEDFIVSINFSPNNFYHANFIDWAQSDDIFTLPLNWVELEVTERLMLRDEPVVINGLNQLKIKGVKFSLDDFGVGYSSLAYIKNFSDILSKIKIDKMFVGEVTDDGFDGAFVKSVMMLANSLNLDVLAEGIENQYQFDWLKKNRCRYAQGFYFEKPMPATAIETLLSQPETLQANHNA